MKNKIILIVEDELLIAMFNKQVVEEVGHIVLKTLTNGEDAIEFMKNNTVDLILMGIMLDGESDGVQAMEEIRKFSNVPVIYVTGNSNKQVKERAFNTNYSDFIVKPIAPLKLVEAIELA